jgi:hypothetical protein
VSNTFAPTVEITRVYEKVSKNGNRYLVGRLGKARILLFEAERTNDGTPTWTVWIQADLQPAAQNKPAPSSAGRAPRQGTLFKAPGAKPARGPALPDDRVDNLWRSEP